MGWSTRQLAELAGTTVKAVRHYHKVGLLEEPERAANGYKRYGVGHLTRLLRIRRLTDIGLSLAQIADISPTAEPPEETLRHLDSELTAAVERLQRVRDELALILAEQLPTDLPTELAPVAAHLTEEDRALALVMTRVSAPETAEAYIEVMRESASYPADSAFENLPADADEQARSEVAAQMLALVRRQIADHPALDWAGPPTATVYRTAVAMNAMMNALYNPAQRDVLHRVGNVLAEERHRNQRS